MVPGTIPATFIPAIEIGLREAAGFGLLPGHPVYDVRVELVDGSYHDADSSEMAFKIAAAMAFLDALRNAGPIVDSLDDDHASGVS
jgi:elongation factor G